MVREKQTSDVYALKTLRKEAAARRALSAADERAVLGAGAGPWFPRLQYAFQVSYNVKLLPFGLHSIHTLLAIGF